jgi:glycosyltransferase involved in cell wall biosynthesis
MASGVPLVTTRVGQATDLVRHGENGWIVDVVARRTAEANTHETQLSQWREFMRGFVALGEAAGR